LPRGDEGQKKSRKTKMSSPNVQDENPEDEDALSVMDDEFGVAQDIGLDNPLIELFRSAGERAWEDDAFDFQDADWLLYALQGGWRPVPRSKRGRA
jgi:hypothetical protein